MVRNQDEEELAKRYGVVSYSPHLNLMLPLFHFLSTKHKFSNP